MKQTRPEPFLTREILAFVQDDQPTPEALIARFGEPCYHLLRKAGAVVEDGGRLRLSRRHLMADARQFAWGNQIIHLDDDSVYIVVRAPGGGPPFDGPP